MLLDRLEYDAADGAFCLGLYGDPAARPALEKMLAEIPEEEVELRREIAVRTRATGCAPSPSISPSRSTSLAEYPEHELPAFDVLDEAERIEMLDSPDADIRAGAAHSFFNQELDRQARAALVRNWRRPIRTPKFAGEPGHRWRDAHRRRRHSRRA